ncbi:hypothetical protein H1Q58_15015 [Planococcus maritimus]|uniref:Uncharacterized protein n=1 Tax=Planococcus maritimus TaxID=192421 RepID=A0A7D7MFT3_PLAMR|nr:hypothetical protein [Planococcus maritimus]OED33610.1 hypothetical protein BHE17_14565 [Planococcus maritimus]QMT17250.1 hypothetical protein H1Q58_15015 [Planococcus maritimus]
MQRIFFSAIALSAVLVWWHLFFDLRAVLPDPAARLTLAIALFVLFIGLMRWIVQQGQQGEPRA